MSAKIVCTKDTTMMVHFHNAPAEKKQNIDVWWRTLVFNMLLDFKTPPLGIIYIEVGFLDSIENSSLGLYFLQFSISSQPYERHLYLLQILCQSREESKNYKGLNRDL